ncbi:MAG: hypothetical protein ACREFQ_15565 [Stellaceae bacterium]
MPASMPCPGEELKHSFARIEIAEVGWQLDYTPQVIGATQCIAGIDQLARW